MNMKKCDRCGKVYSWEYKPMHARVMVYDEEGHLHSTDLCPECDKAAAKWMHKGSVVVSTLIPAPGGVEFAFKNSKDADDFMTLMRGCAVWYGIATMEDAKVRYASVTRSEVEKNSNDAKYGWYRTSLDDAALLKTRSGWVIRLPEPVSLGVCRKE